MGASSLASQRPLPLPETHSTRYPNHASAAMTTSPSDKFLGGRPASSLPGAAPLPPSLTPSSAPVPPFFSSTNSTETTRAPSTSTSILTPPGAVPDGFSSSGSHSSGSQSSQPGGPPLYYSGHMTGSWPTPGLSQPSAYTYTSSNPGGSGQGSLAQPPYTRAPNSYASASSPSLQHFPGRAASSAPNGDSLPAPHSYQDQHGFPSPVGTGAGAGGTGGGLGSPLSAHSQGGNHQPGLGQSMLGNSSANVARQAASAQGTSGGGPGSAQEGNSYRQPPTPTNYYPPASAAQHQSFSSYASPSTQPSPTTVSPTTGSGSIPRGPSSIPPMAPPVQFSGGRAHPVPSMVSYASYSPVPGPVLSNMHHPGAPLAMVGGMAGLSSYSHHPSLSPHHPHHLYVHHSGAPPPQSERPFKCNECAQAFNRNHDLKRHQRIHMAVKPFGCNDCEKRFSRKDALKRHRLVKGCGGTSTSDATENTAGGSEGSSHDRGATGGGDRECSPRGVKKDI